MKKKRRNIASLMKILDSKTSVALNHPGEFEDLDEGIKSMMTKSKIRKFGHMQYLW